MVLYDLSGKEVYGKTLESRAQMDLDPPVTPGVYFLEIRGQAGIWSERVSW